MTYFIAWIVIGVCCYFIGKNRRDRYLPKYHTGMLFIQRSGEELNEPATPENVVRWSKLVESAILIVDVVLAPLSLILCFKKLFTKGPGEGILKMKACCDEFAKRNGLVF